MTNEFAESGNDIVIPSISIRGVDKEKAMEIVEKLKEEHNIIWEYVYPILVTLTYPKGSELTEDAKRCYNNTVSSLKETSH